MPQLLNWKVLNNKQLESTKLCAVEGRASEGRNLHGSCIARARHRRRACCGTWIAGRRHVRVRSQRLKVKARSRARVRIWHGAPGHVDGAPAQWARGTNKTARSREGGHAAGVARRGRRRHVAGMPARVE